MLTYFFEPAILDGNEVFVKWALRRKVTRSGIEISLSPSELLDSTQKRVLKEKLLVEHDRSATSDHVKSVRMSRLERKDGFVIIKIFFSGFANSPMIYNSDPFSSEPKKKR